MKTEVLSQEKNVLVVKAEFEASEVNTAIAKTIKNLSDKANIKGFRKGHVPRRAIELYFGKQGIYQETMEEILQSAVERAVEEYDLDLLGHPGIKPAELEEDKPYAVEITFEVTPEVALPELSLIEAEKTVYLPTEDMERQNMERMLEASSEIVPLYEEREVKADDYVSVKFSSSVVNEDATTSPVETDQKTEIFLGQENIRPQIVEAMTGKKPGETVTVEFPVEEEADTKELAGKTMRYDIEILGLMQKQTPELSDATAERISHGRYKSVEDFKRAVKEQLQASADRESEESLKASAVQRLVEMSEVELPESIVDRQINAMKQERAEHIKRESGLAMEEFLEKSGMDKESYDTEVESAAKMIVKRSLVLDALANKEGIQTTPEEFDSELQRLAVASRMEFDKLRKMIMSDNERIYEITSRIRNRKTIDFLVTQVKVTEIAGQTETEETTREKPLDENAATKLRKEPKAKKETK